MTENKIVCTPNQDQGYVLMRALLAAGELEVRQLKRIKHRLEDKPDSQVKDFASRVDNARPGLYEFSVSMNQFASHERQIKEMMRFRAEIERITGVPCDIDCSELRPPPHKKKSRCVKKRT